MGWTWPFNGRAGDGQRNNGNSSSGNGARPDFLCIGVHKGGTTWLYRQLDSHPDFWMPPLKELHYLDQLSRVQRSSSPRCRDDRDRRFLENINSLRAKPHLDFEHYAQLFEPKGTLLSGDISPNYSTLNNEVIRRVVRYFPNLKVICLARDPVERLWSHLSMEVHYHQIEAFDVTDIDEINRQLLRRGLLRVGTRARSSPDGNGMLARNGFASISLTTCKEIRLNCGVASSIFWVPILAKQTTAWRPTTKFGDDGKASA